MKAKNHLRTVRFQPSEAALMDEYINKNKLFESFSALARVATLSFISQAEAIGLNPVIMEKKAKRPAFLWDYDLTDVQVREILGAHGLPAKKKWLMERILGQSRFEGVLEYLDVGEIKRALPSLRLAPKIKERWEYALTRWGV